MLRGHFFTLFAVTSWSNCDTWFIYWQPSTLQHTVRGSVNAHDTNTFITNHKFSTVCVFVESFSAGREISRFHKIRRSAKLIPTVSRWPHLQRVKRTPLSQRQSGSIPSHFVWDMWRKKSQRGRIFPSTSVRSPSTVPPTLHTHISFTCHRSHTVSADSVVQHTMNRRSHLI
jgi:hypothetical protein